MGAAVGAPARAPDAKKEWTMPTRTSENQRALVGFDSPAAQRWNYHPGDSVASGWASWAPKGAAWKKKKKALVKGSATKDRGRKQTDVKYTDCKR